MTDRPHILVVEDDPEIAAFLARYLRIRYDVTIANDGEEGLAALLRPPPPQLAIVDVMMPKMNGFTMIRKMRAAIKEGRPTVIFLTARELPGDVVKGIQEGARHYLTKPVRLDDLDQKVRKILGM